MRAHPPTPSPAAAYRARPRADSTAAGEGRGEGNAEHSSAITSDSTQQRVVHPAPTRSDPFTTRAGAKRSHSVASDCAIYPSAVRSPYPPRNTAQHRATKSHISPRRCKTNPPRHSAAPSVFPPQPHRWPSCCTTSAA